MRITTRIWLMITAAVFSIIGLGSAEGQTVTSLHAVLAQNKSLPTGFNYGRTGVWKAHRTAWFEIPLAGEGKYAIGRLAWKGEKALSSCFSVNPARLGIKDKVTANVAFNGAKYYCIAGEDTIVDLVASGDARKKRIFSPVSTIKRSPVEETSRTAEQEVGTTLGEPALEPLQARQVEGSPTNLKYWTDDGEWVFDGDLVEFPPDYGGCSYGFDSCPAPPARNCYDICNDNYSTTYNACLDTGPFAPICLEVASFVWAGCFIDCLTR